MHDRVMIHVRSQHMNHSQSLLQNWGDLVIHVFALENRKGLVGVRGLHLGSPEEFLCSNTEIMRRWGLQVEKNPLLLPVSGTLVSLLCSDTKTWGLITLASAFAFL